MAQGNSYSAAAARLDFLVELPLLLPQDKKAVLKLLRGLDPSGFDLIARSGHGISVFRTHACSSNSIYRITGMGDVAAAPRGVFELLCNVSLIPEWDVLFKSGRYLSYARDPAGRCEVAYLRIVYGLPGVSRLVSDREFILRAVRVFLPNGMCVLACRSAEPGEVVAAAEDEGPTQPRMIRGHMWDSGYVVVPTPGGCCVSVTLQVDPKGWIPTTVINWSLEAIPLNIQRVRSAVSRLGHELLALLPGSSKQQGEACGKRPPLELLGRLPAGWAGGQGSGTGSAITAAAAAAAYGGGDGGSDWLRGDGQWWLASGRSAEGREGERGGSSTSGRSTGRGPGVEDDSEGFEWFDAMS